MPNTNQLAALQNELTRTLADTTMGQVERADAILRIRRAISAQLRTTGLGITGLADLAR